LQEVQVLNIADFNTRNVSECLDEWSLFGINNEWSSSLNVSSVSHLSNTNSDLAGILNSFNVIKSAESLQDGNGFGGLVQSLDGLIVNNKRDFRDRIDLVSSSHNKSRESRSSKGRGNGNSLLVDVDLSVPSSPDLSRCEHSSSTAHVTESSLSSSVGSSSRNSWNTRHSSSSTPRFSAALVTSEFGHSVWLSLVLGQVSVDLIDNVRTNWCSEDNRETDVRISLGGGGVNSY